ncbi:MAG: hypothetical protein ACK4F0_04210, partial [Candidatus Ratteibacteria bacterium]
MTKIINLLFGFISGIITARYLGVSGRGTLALFQTVISILIPIMNLGVKQSTAYIIGQKKYKEDDIYISLSDIYLFTSFIGGITLTLIYSKIGLIRKYGWYLP